MLAPLYYAKRIKELGFLNTLERIKARAHKKIYKLYWKSKALKLNANHSWKQICRENFDDFFEKLKQKNFTQKILESKEFQQFLANQDLIKNKVPFLSVRHDGSIGSPCSESNGFYQDIKIEQKKCKSFDDYCFDIKVPWEESRFQHFFHPEYNEYNFITQINNWIYKNPYLLGVNWICPMEVAIRAINWIYGFYFFKDYKNIPHSFWQKFICSLYDHAKYLENNWETSDKPNNHYIADLIGYYYLCFFFEDLKHLQKQKEKTYKKILQQFDHQIQEDGTCYEGSTNYHKLVTEIFLHFHLLCKTNNIKLPSTFYPKFKKMIQFLQNCSDQNGNLVQIGDNDSGKILVGIKPKPNTMQNKMLCHYPNFGLSIIKNNGWHITFRHLTYNKKQPTGHFHQDELSITLSINGIPVLVDPGTYLYTASTKWRNLMRSKQMHNTFYIKDEKLKNLENLDLFQLPKNEQMDTAQIKQNDELIEIQNFYNNPSPKLLRTTSKQFRKLIFNQDENILKLEDWWTLFPFALPACRSFGEGWRSECVARTSRRVIWNLIFHPQINLQKEKNNWIIYHKTSKILKFESDLELKEEKSFYSPEYGKIEPCLKLFAEQKIEHLKKIISLFRKI